MTDLIETKRRHALSGWPMIIAWVGMLVFAFHSCTRMVGAGDTWVAMACGRHFINHGVDTVEPFSAYSHKAGPTEEDVKKWPEWAQWITDKVGLETVRYWHPTGWVNQNWLTHVFFYWVTHLSPFADASTYSYNSLVYWKIALYIITIICVYYTGRILGVNPALSAAFACFALFIGRSFHDIRPAGFSNLLVAVFLLILALTTYRNVLYIWLIVPLAVLWCNLHGGYIYLFIVLVPFFIIHLLITLPKRWTVTVHDAFMWGGLYVLAYKFVKHAQEAALARFNFEVPMTPPGQDWLLYLILTLILINFIITAVVRIKDRAIYGYNIACSLIVVFSVLPRFFPKEPPNLILYYPSIVKEYIKYVIHSQLFFVVVFVGLVAIGLVVTFQKNKLVCVKLKGVFHTIAVAFVALVTVIIFNPFHLTNLTHTFVISMSKHAEMWRTVNEWHPAFEWKNPVGTGFPFLVLFVLSIGLAVLWLFSRLLKPKVLIAPKNEIEAQKKHFNILSIIMSFAATVLICWVTFLSFSFLNLDFVSFFICALFAGILLLSVYKSVHFIYLVIPLSILAVGFLDQKWLEVLSMWFGEPDWLQNIPKDYLGRYIYPFVLIPSYVILHIIVSSVSKKIKINLKNITFVILTAVGALVLMTVLVNPFEIESHWTWNTLKRFWELHRLFCPPYERNVDLNYKHLFKVLYILNLASIILWFTFGYLRKIFTWSEGKKVKQTPSVSYELPKIDLSLIAIAGLTIYMAIRSRRFIPIAGIVACPITAMFIEQMVRTISAAFNFHRQSPANKKQELVVSPMPHGLQRFFVLIGAVVVLGLGTFWGLKFKYIYLDFWPSDEKLNSVFMRMTASDAKPFYACDFIRMNKLEGKMFNYWTEGGFIAYGQEPDPNTGRTPLQLFMDGRAQAAYEPITYTNWSDIITGGPIYKSAMIRGSKLTFEKYVEIGRWIDKELKKEKVWIVLMPAAQFDNTMVRGLELHSDWVLVFFNNKQKMFADISTPQGLKLANGIITGETVYPDEFSRNLTLGHNMLLSTKPDIRAEGLEYVIKALKMNPSPAPVLDILIIAVRYTELRPRIFEACKNFFDEFTQDENKYKEDGCRRKLIAAYNVGSYLQRVAEEQKDMELAEFYKTKKEEYSEKQEEFSKTKRW